MAKKNDKQDVSKLGDIATVPFQGGCNTVLETQQIPMGEYSMIQNMRSTHPGFKKRKGQRALHTVADGTNEVKTLYQFQKAGRDEKHTYAQNGDNDVLEATNAPPEVTTGAFGSEVFSGSASSVPASWGNVKDMLLFSNGVDQHQIYPGSLTYVNRLVVYDGDAAPPNIPTKGRDYSDEAGDGLTSTVVVLDSLNTYANHECVFVMSEVPMHTLRCTVSLPNGTTSALSAYYWNGSWTEVTGLSDGTASGGATFAQTGNITWTLPTDSYSNYMYGECGYWIQLRVSVQLDSEVELTAVEYTTDWQSIENIWDGIPVDVIETQYYDASADIYKTYGATSIEIDSATSSDKVYFATTDPICAFYVGVGSRPNTTADSSVDALYHWTGTAFASVGTITDGTAGLSNSGWVTFPRVTSHKRQFNKNQYYAYWYYFTVDKTLSDDVIISLLYQPYFDINKFGKGYCNAVWKNRAIYGFDKDQYIYVSAVKRPQVLNGGDYAILEPGDGRANKPLAMAKFYNELMVWQEEKGKEGGCLTLFEGYSPLTFGKLVLSTRVGILNAKCVAVVDGTSLSFNNMETVSTMAFWLSHYGVYASDGQRVTCISNDIQNYFDPLESECIRRGYENKMWLGYNSAYNIIRIGIVSGESATECNVFPVYDITDNAWSFDKFGQNLSCVTEVTAGSGNVDIIQIAGGVDDGTVYQSNYLNDDVNTAIDSYVIMELNARGKEMWLREMILRLKENEGGCTITPYIDGVAQTAITID